MTSTPPEPAITRLPTELWQGIIEIVLYDHDLFEQSIARTALYSLTPSKGERRVKSVGNDLRLVSRSWCDYTEVAYTFLTAECNATDSCPKCWLANHRDGTFLHSCGDLSHAVIHPHLSSMTTVILVWYYSDACMTPDYLCTFYKQLSGLPSLLFLCMKIDIGGSQFVNTPITHWEVGIYTLPRLEFLAFAFGDNMPMPCLLPLALPSLLELSVEDYESGEVVGTVLPELLGRNGRNLRKLELDSVMLTTLPINFAAILPALEVFLGDLPAFTLGPDLFAFQLPRFLRKVIHIGEIDEEFWECDVVRFLASRVWDAIDGAPEITLELRYNWQELVDAAQFRGVEEARLCIEKHVQDLLRAGVRVHDETQKQWHEL